ncbi:Bromodomain [Dillenia turbinata]|uniref:Bromodomain n=1 Tax=Dillenia turbinata TaxID=194707 RepID=A0AAN8URR9_9MAGN
MGRIVEKKTKKKKGRPSLLDLQKRTLKEQQQQQELLQKQKQKRKQKQKLQIPNPNSNPNPLRRSTRRNHNPVEINENATTDGDDELSSASGKRREKKLKLVLKLPQNQQQSSDSANSGSRDTNIDDVDGSTHPKKRKINAIGDGSSHADTEKEEKPILSSNAIVGVQGIQLDLGPSTRLPDKKLLLFILDRLQKKDTYGVFSEPVDPKDVTSSTVNVFMMLHFPISLVEVHCMQLPDYHEVIAHPMDFGTVRKKLGDGDYANLEQFEKDIFLICSNAMQYNAPDTIYFRQARSIQELAKKNFENLRQDSDDNEPEPKVVRRGRPPTKSLKKSLGRPSLESAGADFQDAALTTGVESTIWSNSDLKRGSLIDKSGLVESSGRLLSGHNNDGNFGLLSDHKSEKNEEFSGPCKKKFVSDDNKRITYKQSRLSVGREPSVFTLFIGERKHIIPVGLHSEYGYAMSLARYAANLGPSVWKIASKRIERSLPTGVMFGPGWVGDNDTVPSRLQLSSQLSCQLSSPQPSLPETSSFPATLCLTQSNGDNLSGKPQEHILSEKHAVSARSITDGPPSISTPASGTKDSSPTANRSCEPTAGNANVGELNSQAGFNILNSSTNTFKPKPPFQMQQDPVFHPGRNGLNGYYGINLPAQMGNCIVGARATGLNLQSSSVIDAISRTNNNFAHPITSKNNSEGSKIPENPKRTDCDISQPKTSSEAPDAPKARSLSQPSWQRLAPKRRPESVPTDLNVGFQSPTSSPSSQVDTTQPDLALQL